MVALARSKKGKVDGPNKSKMILLRYYIKFGPRISRVTRISQNKRLRHGEQVNRNFGIKSFLSQNWGGMCLHQNLGRRTWELKASKIASIKESIA